MKNKKNIIIRMLDAVKKILSTSPSSGHRRNRTKPDRTTTPPTPEISVHEPVIEPVTEPVIDHHEPVTPPATEHGTVTEPLPTPHHEPVTPPVSDHGTVTPENTEPEHGTVTPAPTPTPEPTPEPTPNQPTPPQQTEGFMTRNPNNPHRWTLNGKAFYPIGIGDCFGTHGNGVMNDWSLDGSTDIDTYLKTYSDAGFNLFGWSVDNCSFKLLYADESNWAIGDTLAQKLRQYGFHIMFVFFNDVANESPEGLAYIKKAIDRYGQFVDVWEISNETMHSDAKLRTLAKYIKANDPAGKPVTSSVRQRDGNLDEFDLVSPHFYFSNDTDFIADTDTWNLLKEWKRYGKSVIVGEVGNQTAKRDATSAMRMRLRSWTAFFAEGVLIFWNTSGNKTYKGSPANIYLGTEERSFIRVLQNFTSSVPADAAMWSIQINRANEVRGYALKSAFGYFAYLHNFTNHVSATGGITVTVSLPIAGTAAWIEPSTGRILSSTEVSKGEQTLTVPPFLIDVALKVKNRNSI